MWVTSEHMGMGNPDDPLGRSRAAATTKAIKAYLDEPLEL
jgi:hypothetical protein